MAAHADERRRSRSRRGRGEAKPQTYRPRPLHLLVIAAVLTAGAVMVIAIIGGLAGGVLAGVMGGLALAAVCECARRSAGRQQWTRRHRG
jgi:hypothetical protein